VYTAYPMFFKISKIIMHFLNFIELQQFQSIFAENCAIIPLIKTTKRWSYVIKDLSRS